MGDEKTMKRGHQMSWLYNMLERCVVETDCYIRFLSNNKKERGWVHPKRWDRDAAFRRSRYEEIIQLVREGEHYARELEFTEAYDRFKTAEDIAKWQLSDGNGRSCLVERIQQGFQELQDDALRSR